MDNIRNFRFDTREDMQNHENRFKKREKLEYTEELIDRIAKESNDRNKINKIQFPNNKEITFDDLAECVRQMLWNDSNSMILLMILKNYNMKIKC